LYRGSLRIGIDAHILGKQKGGVEHTVEILIRSLAATDRANDYFIYVTDRHPFLPGELPPNFHLCTFSNSSPVAGRLLWLPYYYRRDQLDVIYMQRALTLFGCPRTVLHVHDAMYATHPHLFPFWKRHIFNLLFRWSGRKAKIVITPTMASRTDIVREYGVDPSKVRLIPDTVDTREVYVEEDQSAIDAAAAQFELRRPYVIYLGAIERNKNVHGLLEAFAIFHKRLPHFQLALVGKWRSETRAGYSDELQRRIRHLGLQHAVKPTGFVSKDHRRLLLNGATVLVFPSESEGLGLPPIEAMACGVPVIAGAVPAIEEYYGDALLTCRHDDVNGLADLMVRVATDPELAATLRARGFKKAAAHTWDYKAPLMIEAFRAAARD
jgi:glycosyltransferase involved in cell wall biosynthesis